jgi:hypothetical protein
LQVLLDSSISVDTTSDHCRLLLSAVRAAEDDRAAEDPPARVAHSPQEFAMRELSHARMRIRRLCGVSEDRLNEPAVAEAFHRLLIFYLLMVFFPTGENGAFVQAAKAHSRKRLEICSKAVKPLIPMLSSVILVSLETEKNFLRLT